MPSAWVHAAVDLVVFGLPYFDLHQAKDKAHEALGPDHRVVDHDWYQQFGKDWTFSDPFPSSLKRFVRRVHDNDGDEKAGKFQARTSHDYVDRLWNGLSPEERKYWEGFYAWLILRPKILLSWAKVDVVRGRIHRAVNGNEVWEDCPTLRREYHRLRQYVEKVVSKDAILRMILVRLSKDDHIRRLMV